MKIYWHYSVKQWLTLVATLKLIYYLLQALLGKEGHTERWRECVADTDVALGYALGAMFVRHVFQRKSKEEAQVMIDSIKTAFEHRLDNLKWMDDTTRQAALVKAKAISDMIGKSNFDH